MSHQIDFCDKQVLKITDDYIKESIFTFLDKIFETTLHRCKFPGPQPVSIMKNDLHKLNKKNKYIVCEKTDGERFLMVLCKIRNKPMCFLLDRNVNIFYLPLTFQKELFEGTVFDGELIKNKKKKWVYLIFDCIAFNGISYMNTISHQRRFNAVKDIVTKRYAFGEETDPFIIKLKIFYPMTFELSKTWEHIITTTENNIDGIIFTPCNGSMNVGRQWNLLKWKSENNHTIDFFVQKESKKYNFYVSRGDCREEYKSFGVTSKQGSILKAFVLNEEVVIEEGIIIEFKYDANSKLFTPYRIRKDKSFPNAQFTVDKTIQNIVENITINNLAEAY